jgi:hypothetical protein
MPDLADLRPPTYFKVSSSRTTTDPETSQRKPDQHPRLNIEPAKITETAKRKITETAFRWPLILCSASFLCIVIRFIFQEQSSTMFRKSNYEYLDSNRIQIKILLDRRYREYLSHFHF